MSPGRDRDYWREGMEQDLEALEVRLDALESLGRMTNERLQLGADTINGIKQTLDEHRETQRELRDSIARLSYWSRGKKFVAGVGVAGVIGFLAWLNSLPSPAQLRATNDKVEAVQSTVDALKLEQAKQTEQIKALGVGEERKTRVIERLEGKIDQVLEGRAPRRRPPAAVP